MWVQVVLCLVALLVIRISHWVYSWGEPQVQWEIPPGSMGFPIIGETIQFFSPDTLYDIPPFIKKRVERYGSLFRTSLVGKAVVISTDEEVNHYIFQQEGKMFQCWYTESFVELLGGQSLLAYHGVIHKYLKNLILNLVSPENLKKKLLHEIDGTTRKYFHSWTSHAYVDMVFEYFAIKLFSYDESKASKKLRENYRAFMDVLISYPLNIPGTACHACLQGRKNAMKVIKDIFEERKASNMTPCHDFLDYLLKEVKNEETILTEAIAIDLLFVLLFATFETASAAITLVMKFIADHPLVLAELTKEHEAILRGRENEESEITWGEYKSMTFTHMVINETVRLANIVPGIFRKVIKDVESKGYTIPAGWLVMVCPAALHLNPDKYGDPLAFNPWRWEGQEFHGFWWGCETLCGSRLSEASNGHFSPLLGHKVQVDNNQRRGHNWKTRFGVSERITYPNLGKARVMDGFEEAKQCNERSYLFGGNYYAKNFPRCLMLPETNGGKAPMSLC